MLKNSECYIVETIKVFNDAVGKEEIRLETACEFVRYFANRELRNPISCYQIVMDIIGDLLMFKQLIQQKENLLIEKTEEEKRRLQEAVDAENRRKEEERRQKDEEEKRRQQEASDAERRRKEVEEQRQKYEEERREQEAAEIEHMRKEVERLRQAEEKREGTTTDNARRLMWQRSGSDNTLNFREAKAYIQELNCRNFAGYSDWRLPTSDELASLITKKKQSNGIFIDPKFDSKQYRCWSSIFFDKSDDLVVLALFDCGRFGSTSQSNERYVRAVRTCVKLDF